MMTTMLGVNLPRRRRPFLVMLVLLLSCFNIVTAVNVPLQYSFSHRYSHRDGRPFLGLLMAYPTEEMVLQSSGLFVPDPITPYFQLAGRTFNIGKIGNVPVVYVMSGEQTVNAAMTVQILVDTFDILGVVHYGTAGCINGSMSLGDVSVPDFVALTSSWKWMDFESEETRSTSEIKFGAYNLPRKGPNLLAAAEFTPVEVYSNGHAMKEAFWLPVEPKWFDLAANNLQDVQLERCLNETYCLPRAPQVVYGLRGATADVFLENVAYGRFLFRRLNISTVDEESAAVVMVSLSNQIPCIVFRGVSDMETGEENGKLFSSSLSALAASNALKMAVKFIALFDEEAALPEPRNRRPVTLQPENGFAD